MKRIKNNEKCVFHYVKLKNQLHFSTNLQNMEQHTGGRWLIHATKHRQDNQWKAWYPSAEYHSLEYKFDIKEFETSPELILLKPKIVDKHSTRLPVF